jgi:PAS domain S-box-containing protein
MVKKVLIVDDNSNNLYILETLLKRSGFEVVSAENGKDALDKARLNPPDLIVTDILMPVMDGYALCREWKSDDALKHIPFVFYTATYTEPKDEKFALSLGADRFTLKPQKSDVLVDMLKEVLEEKYTARQAVTKPLGKEMEFFRQHNEVLFNKLEKKMLDLEIANQELRTLKERYQLFFENVADVIYTIDTNLNVSGMSPSVERILGYKPQDFIGRPVSDLGKILMPESFEQAVADISLILKGDTIPSTIYRFIAKDGTIKCGEVSGSPLVHEGKIIGIISIARDITDRKQAEEALRESEKKYRALIETTQTGFVIINQIGLVLDANPEYVRLTGHHDLSDIVGRSVIEWTADHEKEKNAAAVGECVRKGYIRNLEIDYVDSKGNITPIEINATYMESRGVAHILTLCRDITERKRVEEALQESEEKYRWVLNNMADVITVMDMNLRFTYVSPSIIRMRGYTAEEAVAQTFEQVMTPESLQISAKVFEEEMTLEASGTADPDRIRIVEVEQYRKDGSIVLMENHLSFMRDEAKKPVGIIAVSHDITERKRVEKELEESKSLTEAVVENVPLMIFLKESTDLRFVIFNRAGEELLGYDRKGLLGKNNLDLFPPEQAAQFMAKDREVLDGEVGILDIPEEPIQTAKKGQRLLHTRKVCIRGADGTTKYLLGISEDITDRKRVEEHLKETLTNLRKAFGTTIQVMISAIEVRDPYTAGHQIRSTDLARAIATEMGLPQHRIEGIRMAGSIHDIGKISIPAEILSKPTKLSEIEFSLIKEHAHRGFEMLKDVESPWPLAQIVYQHHERMDGSGYPRNLKGEEILIEARILAVADVVEAMASHRPYRPGLGIDAALKEIEKNKGIFYDNAVADACLRLFREKGFKLEGA